MAQIRKRGPSQYQARVRIQGYPEFTQTFPTRQAAQGWATQKEKLLLLGGGGSMREADNLTLYEALERYAKEVTPLKKGRIQELRRIKIWQKDPLAVRPVSSVRGADLATYRDLRQSAGAGANTIRIELALISHLYEVTLPRFHVHQKFDKLMVYGGNYGTWFIGNTPAVHAGIQG